MKDCENELLENNMNDNFPKIYIFENRNVVLAKNSISTFTFRDHNSP